MIKYFIFTDYIHILVSTVFLFSILGMGAGPSELGKLAREKWKLGKVETCLKAFKYSNHILRHCKIEIPFKRLV